MSAAELPEDMAGWPSDPFALLGVSPGAADADIKRAYTRLVRRFKPEHHPEQFRRIREAYEWCQERAAWYRDEPAETQAPSPPPETPRRPVANPPPSHEPVIDRPVTPAPESDAIADPAVVLTPTVDPVEAWWEVAIEGREEAAYRGLAGEHAAGLQGPTVSLRLYWLLALNPSLDTTRTRHHWLADALVRSRLRGPAVELYRRELESDPEGALDGQFVHGPYSRVLAAEANAADAQVVARERIAAAGRLGWYARIASDLTLLRNTLPMADEGGWLGLLAVAGGWVAWSPSQEFEQFIKPEEAGVSHLQLSHARLFDRLEECEQIAKDTEWGRYNAVPPDLLRLAQISFADPGYARPSEVEAAATALARWGVNVMGMLDTAFVNRPGHLALLGREFEHYLQSRDLLESPAFPPARLRGLARQAGLHRLGGYVHDARQQTLDFLLGHAVHPLEFARALSEDPSEAAQVFAFRLREDITLRVVWLAGRVLAG